ncbi:MAG: hypothetical protein HY286_00470 [Planctomycetes bacterium]|nr:hypothetical protein [Planctomycetota bacterium]
MRAILQFVLSVAWFVHALCSLCLTTGLTQGEYAPTNQGASADVPLAIIENCGQWPAQILWAGASGRVACRGIESGFVLTCLSDGNELRKETLMENVSFIFEGADPNARLDFADRSTDSNNFFLNNNCANWRPSVSASRDCVIKEIYPNTDVRLHSDNGVFEYDIICNNVAELSHIVLRIDGARSVRLDPDGELLIEVTSGEIRQHVPVSYWRHSGRASRKADVRCSILSGNRLSFDIKSPEAGDSIVIDPTITFSTFWGPGVLPVDSTYAASNKSGETAITCNVNSPSFPTTPGAYDVTYNDPGGVGFADVFVRKMNSTGNNLIYSTFIGGNGMEDVPMIGMDQSGNTYLCGGTSSTNFPLTAGAPWLNAGVGGYICKLNASGSALLFSSYFANIKVVPYAIASDGVGNAYATGLITGQGLLTTPNAFNPFGNLPFGGFGMFTVKMDTVNSSLAFGTYFASNSSDTGYAIAPDGIGGVWVLGETNWTAMPVTVNAVDQTSSGSSDTYLIKFNAQGSSLDYATWLDFGGDPGSTWRDALFYRDPFIYIYFHGFTNLPTTPGAYVSSPSLGSAMIKIHPASASIVFSTYLGISLSYLYCGMDESGNSYFTRTATNTMPPLLLTSDAFKKSVTGPDDGYIMKLNNTGTGVLFGSYFGAAGDDMFGQCMGVGSDNCLVLGASNSIKFPVTPGAYDTTPSGYKYTLSLLVTPSDPVGVIPFGTGTAGCNGLERLSANEPVASGASNLQFISSNAPPSSVGALIISDQADLFGSDTFGLGILVHVGLNTTNLSWLDMYSDAWGTGFTDSKSLATGQVIPGQVYYLQSFWLWPSGGCSPSNSNLSSSNGLAITIQP